MSEGEFRARVTEGLATGMTPRQVIAYLGIPPKRARYWLEKWARQGGYEYGVAVDLGWITPPTSASPTSTAR